MSYSIFVDEALETDYCPKCSSARTSKQTRHEVIQWHSNPLLIGKKRIDRWCDICELYTLHKIEGLEK